MVVIILEEVQRVITGNHLAFELQSRFYGFMSYHPPRSRSTVVHLKSLVRAFFACNDNSEVACLPALEMGLKSINRPAFLVQKQSNPMPAATRRSPPVGPRRRSRNLNRNNTFGWKALFKRACAQYRMEEASCSSAIGREFRTLSLEVKNEEAERGVHEEMNPDLWSELPDALLDKIFARLPLRSLFRTRILSKKWDSAITRSLSFQTEISALSSGWESYCPVFWSWSCEWLIGYDRRSKRWHKLFKISYFPGISKVRWLSGGGAGSLLCFHQGGWNGGDLFIHVTNPFLRNWHKLPSTNTPSRPMLDIVHAIRLGLKDYEVIVITQDDRNMVVDEAAPFSSPRSALSAEIYNRFADSWTTDSLGPLVPRDLRKVSSAYFDGTLYFVLANSGFKSFKNLRLFAYQVTRRRWTVLAHPFEDQDDVYQCGLVVCDSQVLLIMMNNRDRPLQSFKFPEAIHGPSYIARNSIHIHRIDQDSYQITDFCRGPDEDIHDAEIVEGLASDDECLYLQAYGHGIVLQFNVLKRVWSCISIDSGPVNYHSRPDISSRWFGPNFKWTNVTFQPGLNPFAMQ